MHSEPHAYTCRVCLFFSSTPWALNNLETYMVITLTLKIYKHEKCIIDMPLAQPFMCFIWQNILSIPFCFKMLFLKSVQLLLLSVFSCSLSHLAFVSLDQRVYSIWNLLSAGHSTILWQQNSQHFLFLLLLFFPWSVFWNEVRNNVRINSGRICSYKTWASLACLGILKLHNQIS